MKLSDLLIEQYAARRVPLRSVCARGSRRAVSPARAAWYALAYSASSLSRKASVVANQCSR